MALFKRKKKKADAAEGEEPQEEAAEAEKEEAPEPEAEGEEGEEGAPKPKKKSKKKLIIFALLGVLVLAGIGAGVYFSGILSGPKSESSAQLGPDGKPIEQSVFYTLPEFLVNLNSGGKQTTFLKTTVILELPSQGDIAVVEANLPRLLDSFNTYLRELRASDLAGSSGIQRLREELLLRANKSIAPTKINDVLFKEIVVQ